jgi:hypothetical protein
MLLEAITISRSFPKFVLLRDKAVKQISLRWRKNCSRRLQISVQKPELEFLKRLWGLGTGEEEGYRTGPPGYIGWRNSFFGINSRAPYTFKNTSSVVLLNL